MIRNFELTDNVVDAVEVGSSNWTTDLDFITETERITGKGKRSTIVFKDGQEVSVSNGDWITSIAGTIIVFNPNNAYPHPFRRTHYVYNPDLFQFVLDLHPDAERDMDVRKGIKKEFAELLLTSYEQVFEFGQMNPGIANPYKKESK